MDFIKEFIKEQGTAIAAQLAAKAGFSEEEARQFIPEATQAAVNAVRAAGGNVKALLAGGAGALLQAVDVAALANRLGVDQAKINSGLQQLLPILLAAIQAKAGALESIVTSLSGKKPEELLQSAKSVAAKLFRASGS